MSEEDATAAERLVRVLEVLAVAGGAALVERDSDELSVVAGEVDDGLLARARLLSIPRAVAFGDVAFSERVSRSASLLGRHVFKREASGPAGPSTPPSANAALFARVPRPRA